MKKYLLQILFSAIMVAGGLSLLGWHIAEFSVWAYFQSLIGIWFIMTANAVGDGLTKWLTK